MVLNPKPIIFPEHRLPSPVTRLHLEVQRRGSACYLAVDELAPQKHAIGISAPEAPNTHLQSRPFSQLALDAASSPEMQTLDRTPTALKHTTKSKPVSRFGLPDA